jgi:hypothetical protein
MRLLETGVDRAGNGWMCPDVDRKSISVWKEKIDKRGQRVLMKKDSN